MSIWTRIRPRGPGEEAPEPEPEKPAADRFSRRKAAKTEAQPTRQAKTTSKPKSGKRKHAGSY